MSHRQKENDFNLLKHRETKQIEFRRTLEEVLSFGPMRHAPAQRAAHAGCATPVLIYTAEIFPMRRVPAQRAAP